MGKAWSMAVLMAQRNAESICTQISREVLRRATASCCVPVGMTCMKISEGILDLIEKKKRIERLQAMCFMALRRMSRLEAGALFTRFVANKSGAAAAALFGVSRRTYYRRLQTGLRAFDAAKDEMGFTDALLDSEYGGDRWLGALLGYAESVCEGVTDCGGNGAVCGNAAERTERAKKTG